MKFIGTLLSLLVIILLNTASNTLAQHSFIEDFTTDTHRNEAGTAMDWNTEVGELRLWPFQPTIDATTNTTGNTARNITKNGRYAYVSDGYAGIEILDLAEPDAPLVLGNFNTPGYVYQIQISGNYAYVADHSGDLRVLDISDPLVPVEIAAVSIPGVVLGLYVEGNYAYLGAGDNGFWVVDVTDPFTPAVMGDHSMSSARSISVVGKYAYVTDGNYGLVVLDITNPAGPFPAYTANGQGTAQDLEVSGNFVYISSANSGLEVFDISDPTQPVFDGHLSVAGQMRGLTVFGNRIFIANDAAGLCLIDISDPTDPVLEGIIDTPGHAYDVIVDGNYAFVADYSGLLSIRISQNVPIIVRGDMVVGPIRGKPAISGNYVFLPEGDSGLRIIDVENIDSPVEVTLFDPGPYVLSEVWVGGDLAVLAINSGGLLLLDISDIGNPVVLGGVDTPYFATDVVVRDHLAYVADVNSLQIVDISDPGQGVIVGSVATGSNKHIAIDGNLVFLYGNSHDLKIVDITNPSLPVVISTTNCSDYILDLAIFGDILFLACGHEGIEVLDISDPNGPVNIGGTFENDEYTKAVEVIGDRIYVASDALVRVYDISDPINPSIRSFNQIDGTEYSFWVSTGEMLVAVGGQDNNFTIDILQVAQHDVDLVRNYGQSSFITMSPEPMVKVRLNSDRQVADSWFLEMIENPYSYISVVENTWVSIPDPGTALSWSSASSFLPGTLSPTHQLKIEWLYDHPLIESVTDIANDQGRQVSVEWVRSGHDFLGDESPIVEYAVYRWIDSDLVHKSAPTRDLSQASTALKENAAIMLDAGYHFLTTVPVRLEDRYAVVVPTLGDSTITNGQYQSVFMVSAITATPGVFFDSPVDSGYSVDNLVPGVPSGIMATSFGGDVLLEWDEAIDDDFRFFRIYRSGDPAFEPGPENLVMETAVASWTDQSQNPVEIQYKITAVDFTGNESQAGSLTLVSDVPEFGAAVFALQKSEPNPFNPSTRINYSLAQAGKVQLLIYDVAGHLVRTLVDDTLPAGQYHARWDGRDQAGYTVSSGVYFSLLRSGELVRRQRMMLMK